MARDFFPLSRDEATKLGAKWQETDYSTFNSDFYEPKEAIGEYIDDETEQQKLLSGAIKCEMTGKPFRILPQELAFYMQHKIPLPRKCFDQRFEERLAKRYKLKLYRGKCMKEGCDEEFTTIYPPDCKEIVYCAKHYEESMI
jgi:hypothetical protein